MERRHFSPGTEVDERSRNLSHHSSHSASVGKQEVKCVSGFHLALCAYRDMEVAAPQCGAFTSWKGLTSDHSLRGHHLIVEGDDVCFEHES